MATQSMFENRTQSQSRCPITRIYERAARLDRAGMALLRLGLVIVLLWIGGLQFAGYHAGTLLPLGAKNPPVSLFFQFSAPQYRPYIKKEGKVVPAHHKL